MATQPYDDKYGRTFLFREEVGIRNITSEFTRDHNKTFYKLIIKVKLVHPIFPSTVST